jgi:hypothetical protein
MHIHCWYAQHAGDGRYVHDLLQTMQLMQPRGWYAQHTILSTASGAHGIELSLLDVYTCSSSSMAHALSTTTMVSEPRLGQGSGRYCNHHHPKPCKCVIHVTCTRKYGHMMTCQCAAEGPFAGRGLGFEDHPLALAATPSWLGWVGQPTRATVSSLPGWPNRQCGGARSTLFGGGPVGGMHASPRLSDRVVAR